MSESKEIIEIVVKEKHCQNPKRCIVCDNSDYQIKFIFDEEWGAYTHKTARFIYGSTKVEKTFSGDTVDVPKIREPGILKVGAFTDDLATTEAEIKCCPSILTRNGVVPDPEDDVYDQVIKLLNTLDTEKVSEKVDTAYSMLNITCNSLIGKASGSVVRVDDVSPIEHTVGCKVRSKNLFNNELDFLKQNKSTWTYENGVLYVTFSYVVKFIELEEGKTYTFSCQSVRNVGDYGGMFISAYDAAKKENISLYDQRKVLSPTVTFTMPKGYPMVRLLFYVGTGASGTDGAATYSNIMLEEGAEATGYVPYVEDIAGTQVARYGKNLLDLSRATFTSAKYNADVNGITCDISNSYYSGARVNYLNDFLLANKGKTLTFSIAEAIPDAMITLLIYGTRTSGRTNQEGSSTGKREISFAISDEFTEITGLEVRVNRFTTAFTDTSTVVRNMQVEVSDTATDFEAYKEPATSTVNSEGTVNGIESLSPTMTLLSDTPNTFIDVEYNLDINVVFARINKLLETLLNGGA